MSSKTPDEFSPSDAFLAKFAEYQTFGQEDAGERWPYRMAAAVLDTFDPETLRPFMPDAEAGGLPEPATGHYPGLEQDATRVQHIGTAGRWRLVPEVRSEALYQIRTRERMEAALLANQDRPQTPVQCALDWIIRGNIDVPRDAKREDLAALLLVIRWLRDVLPQDELPDADACASAYARADLLAPFAHLLADGFIGRRTELSRLNAFFWSENAPAAPAVIFGVGGVGKTTLLGKFLRCLDGNRSQESPVVVVLDLDKPTLQANAPHTLETEIAVQIGRQIATLRPLSEEVRAKSAELARRQSTAIEARHADSSNLEKAEDPPPLVRLLGEAARLSDGGRIALVIDTFEEAQAVGVAYGSAIFDRLAEWMRAVPGLRIIVSGRAGADDGGKRGPQRESGILRIHLANLDRRNAVRMLRDLIGASRAALSDDFLQSVAKAAKGNPLCLKLAARLVVVEGVDRLSTPQEHRGFAEKLKRRRVEAYLVGRILDHVHGEEMKKLIRLALLMRRITRGVITDVLAPASDTHLSDERVEELLKAARNETAFFEAGSSDDKAGETVLRFRSELRKEIWSDVVEDTPADLMHRVDHAAIAFYDGQTDDTAGAEALYHALRAGDVPADELERRWRPAFGPALRRSMPELPPKSRLWLSMKLKVAADADALRVATGRELGLALAPQLERLLALGRAEEVLSLLRERPDASGGRIRLWEAQAQRMRGNLPAAETALWFGIAAAAEEGDVALWTELTLTLAVTLESWDRLDEALLEADKAASAMPPAADRMLRIRAVLTQLRLLRKLGRTEERQRLMKEAVQMLDAATIRALKRHPVLFQEALAELGALSAELVTKGVEWLGLKLFSEDQRGALTSALSHLANSLDRTGKAGLRETIGVDPGDGAAVDRILAENRGVGLGGRVASVLRESQHSGHDLSSEVLHSFRDYFRMGVDTVFQEHPSEVVDPDTVGSLKNFAVAYSRRLRNAGSIDDAQFEAN